GERSNAYFSATGTLICLSFSLAWHGCEVVPRHEKIVAHSYRSRMDFCCIENFHWRGTALGYCALDFEHSPVARGLDRDARFDFPTPFWSVSSHRAVLAKRRLSGRADHENAARRALAKRVLEL